MRKRSTAPARVSRRQFLNTAASAPVAAALWQNGPSQEASVRKRSPQGAATQKKLLECLGGAWPDYGPLKPVVESTIQKDGYKLERVTYLVEPTERIAAYVLVPDGVTAAPTRARDLRVAPAQRCLRDWQDRAGRARRRRNASDGCCARARRLCRHLPGRGGIRRAEQTRHTRWTQPRTLFVRDAGGRRAKPGVEEHRRHAPRGRLHRQPAGSG